MGHESRERKREGKEGEKEGTQDKDSQRRGVMERKNREMDLIVVF